MMRTFAELLREYVGRVGVSDAELARGLGVRRQTIFRWKEGLSERPRHREDVVRLAAKLRLTPEERDGLLLAAGFAPEEGTTAARWKEALPAAALETPSPAARDFPVTPLTGGEGSRERLGAHASEEADGASAGLGVGASGEGSRPREAVLAADKADADAGQAWARSGDPVVSSLPRGDSRGQGGALTAGARGDEAAGGRAWTGRSGRRLTWRAWAAVGLALGAVALLAAALLPGLRGPAYPTAKGNETLVLVAQFVNYGGGQQGYNVAGRVQAAIEQEMRDSGLATGAERAVAPPGGVRAAAWPAEVRNEEAAEAALRQAGAALLIWGEYDSGRVLAHFTAGERVQPPGQVERLLSSPADLPATINSTLPTEVRRLALLALGQVALARGQVDQARIILLQAADRPPAEADSQARLHFFLGQANQLSEPPELDAAIGEYSRALELEPDIVSARANRGAAYLVRRKEGDLERALADLEQTVAGAPDNAPALVNRAAAYLTRNGPGDAAHSLAERALADLDRAIGLDGGIPQAYFNRGIAGIRLNRPAQWQADFAKTLELAPGHTGALVSLCWGHALDGQPEQALPYCELAVEAEPEGPSRDGRGVVYAELGRLEEAAADIRAYLAWIDANPGSPDAGHAAERRAWAAALEAGRNPIDDATRERLRQE